MLTLDKTPLGETGFLSNVCYLLTAQASRIPFQIHFGKLFFLKTLSLIYFSLES